MKFPLRLCCGLLASVPFFAGCAQRTGDDAFTVQQIDPVAEGGVSVKLVSAGDFAEADAGLLVTYVKIVAVHEATRQQQKLAAQRAQAIYRTMTARKQPNKARYLAVSTETSIAPKSRKIGGSVMIWDTQSESIVGTKVYDIETRPASGRVVRFETYSAEYVGSGL